MRFMNGLLFRMIGFEITIWNLWADVFNPLPPTFNLYDDRPHMSMLHEYCPNKLHWKLTQKKKNIEVNKYLSGLTICFIWTQYPISKDDKLFLLGSNSFNIIRAKLSNSPVEWCLDIQLLWHLYGSTLLLITLSPKEQSFSVLKINIYCQKSEDWWQICAIRHQIRDSLKTLFNEEVSQQGGGFNPNPNFFMKELTIYQKGGIFEVSSQHIKANFTSNLSPKMLFAGFPFLFYLEYEGAFQVFLH